ncbi:MAG: prepilin-type N-terminal cleavage/methylation domain-containing protein [bacterium]|nr:prepilin-type N-terminal cleavage/methylation domain-containing protein [bacterium]
MGQNTATGRKIKLQAGFTLIELVISLSILGIILSFAEPIYKNSIIKAKEAALKKDIFIIRDSIDQYYADNSSYPASLEELVEKKYIRSIPEDPFTKSKDTWVIISSVPEEVDVFDIHSGSDLLALDGTAYNEW